MKILVVADPIHALNPKTDSTLFLLRRALARNFEIVWAEPGNLGLQGIAPYVSYFSVLRCAEKKLPVLAKRPQEELLEKFDAIWIRKDPPFDESYMALCWLLGLVEDKVFVMNQPTQLLLGHEKLLPMQAVRSGFLREKDLLPTLVCQGKNKQFNSPAWGAGAVVAKPWLGFGGRGVKKFTSLKKAFAAGKAGEQRIYQPFFSEISTVGDRRVLFINGELVGDFVRLPKRGSIVANLAQGGSAELRPLSAEEEDLCIRIGKFLKSRGIFFAGGDLISHFLTEINITSPTGLQTYLDLSGVDLGNNFLDAMISMVQSRVN